MLKNKICLTDYNLFYIHGVRPTTEFKMPNAAQTT